MILGCCRPDHVCGVCETITTFMLKFEIVNMGLLVIEDCLCRALKLANGLGHALNHL